MEGLACVSFRNWKTRVKGRDWYDFEWYVRRGTRLNFEHFNLRCEQFNSITMSKDEFKVKLKEKIDSTDINLVKQDVRVFLKDSSVMDIWSNEYFKQLVDMITFSD